MRINIVLAMNSRKLPFVASLIVSCCLLILCFSSNSNDPFSRICVALMISEDFCHFLSSLVACGDERKILLYGPCSLRTSCDFHSSEIVIGQVRSYTVIKKKVRSYTGAFHLQTIGLKAKFGVFNGFLSSLTYFKASNTWNESFWGLKDNIRQKYP